MREIVKMSWEQLRERGVIEPLAPAEEEDEVMDVGDGEFPSEAVLERRRLAIEAKRENARAEQARAFEALGLLEAKQALMGVARVQDSAIAAEEEVAVAPRKG